MKRKLFSLALAAGLAAPMTAQAAWRIHIKMAAPVASHWDKNYAELPFWQKRKYWSYYAPMHCWKVVNDKHSVVGANGQLQGSQFFGGTDATIQTDTECAAQDKWFTLFTYIRSANFIPGHGPGAEDTSFTSEHKFTVSGGGVFRDNRYFLDGQMVAKKYWETASLCTDITIHGPGKADEVKTRAC